MLESMPLGGDVEARVLMFLMTTTQPLLAVLTSPSFSIRNLNRMYTQGALVSCILTGAGFCFCSACSSLLGSCCGNDKPSTIPPSVTSGRKRSVLLLFLSIILSLVFQYALAPNLVDNQSLTGPIVEKWLDGCPRDDTNPANKDLQQACAGNYAVYRICAATTLFFVIAMLTVLGKPTANREAWPAKYILWFFLCAATVFIPNEPLWSDIYLNIARIGGMIFVILQQIIILDVAYEWNDSWVLKADTLNEPKWLTAILVSCALLFIGGLVGIILLLVYYTGCPTNDTFISLTLVLGVAITAAQLAGKEGSLLSSACIFAWSVFLCYTAVSMNPNTDCNPRVGEPDNLGIVMGIAVTIISLCWTGWSYTAENKLVTPGQNEDTGDTQKERKDGVDEEATNSGRKGNVQGVVHDSRAEEPGDEGQQQDATENVDTSLLSNSWKLNAILAIVSCWTAMALTNWGTITADGNAANPQVGKTGMWMVIASQWLVMSLYLWTLVAPKLLPGREFG